VPTFERRAPPFAKAAAWQAEARPTRFFICHPASVFCHLTSEPLNPEPLNLPARLFEIPMTLQHSIFQIPNSMLVDL
jgi:hypothetical protein